MSKRGGGFETREILDAVVRALAVDARSLAVRLHAAVRILLGELAFTDFEDREERELFEEIEVALTRLGGTCERDVLRRTVLGMCDTAAEQVASDILDLRDMVVGRTISERASARQRASRHAGARAAAYRYKRR